MGLAAAVTAALAIWIVLWAIGAKALDAILVTLLISVIAIGIKMLLRYLPGARTHS